MCNTSNSPSFKERVQCYINKSDEIKKDYQNRMNALNDEATADILANCPVKVGDVYMTDVTGAWGVKHQYYKVAKLEASVDGTVIVYGYKRKLDKTWGKRDNIYMFMASMYNNYTPTNNYIKVEDYVEHTKD
jgi:hypothetical protein|nr:MAG TPA: hypothetical protein [Crassvirales sp.]